MYTKFKNKYKRDLFFYKRGLIFCEMKSGNNTNISEENMIFYLFVWEESDGTVLK
jgi:hypothetical protein